MTILGKPEFKRTHRRGQTDFLLLKCSKCSSRAFSSSYSSSSRVLRKFFPLSKPDALFFGFSDKRLPLGAAITFNLREWTRRTKTHLENAEPKNEKNKERQPEKNPARLVGYAVRGDAEHHLSIRHVGRIHQLHNTAVLLAAADVEPIC